MSTDTETEVQNGSAQAPPLSASPAQITGGPDTLTDPLTDPLAASSGDDSVQFFLGSLPRGGPFGEEPVFSRAERKEEIRYLNHEDRDGVLDDLLAVRLARYRYKGTAPETPARLGFLIDDQPTDSPAVLPDGERVDVYGFVSMAVAALQAQQARIEALQTRIDALEAARAAG